MKTNARILIPAASLLIAALAIAGPPAVQTAQNSALETLTDISAITYPATIVELFTSQGCSSCPPTNKLVHDLSGTEDLLALTYSVDYWDYLGWKDTLGSPEFSQRQRNYGKQQFQGQVYTPQVILNGDTHAARFAPERIKAYKLQESPTGVTLNKAADGLRVAANGQAGTLVEIRYTPGSQSVPVARGENRGKTITLANVVTSVKKLGSWKKGDGFEAVLVMPPKGEAIAVLVQDGEGGPILTAANYGP
jgi:hypothetical protein